MTTFVKYDPQLHAKDIARNDSSIFDHTILVPYTQEQFVSFDGWVAFKGTNIVGSCLYYIGVDTPREWYFAYLGVLPRYQNKGMGTALLKLLLAEADKNRAYLKCDAATTKAREFYERFGFSVVSTGNHPVLRRRPAGLRGIAAKG